MTICKEEWKKIYSSEVVVFNGPELQALGGLAPRFFHSLLASNTLA